VLFNALIDRGVPRVPVGRCRRRLLLLAGLARLLPLLDFRQLAPALLDRVLTRGPVGAIMFGAKFTDMFQRPYAARPGSKAYSDAAVPSTDSDASRGGSATL
jgi:hypothetical protein